MARLTYADIIANDPKYTALANLSTNLPLMNTAVIMTNLIELVPEEQLDLLAEKWSLTGYDGWALAESVEAKRKLIQRSVELHRHKGTPWAMQEIIRQLGFGEAEILEGLTGKRHDGSFVRNGVYYRGEQSKWAHYRVILKQPITNDQAALLRQTLKVFAPARCVLESLDYSAVALRHNGKATRNGQYNRGAA